MIKAGIKTIPVCENCLYNKESFCSKLNRQTLTVACIHWEERLIGLDIIAY